MRLHWCKTNLIEITIGPIQHNPASPLLETTFLKHLIVAAPLSGCLQPALL